MVTHGSKSMWGGFWKHFFTRNFDQFDGIRFTMYRDQFRPPSAPNLSGTTNVFSIRLPSQTSNLNSEEQPQGFLKHFVTRNFDRFDVNMFTINSDQF